MTHVVTRDVVVPLELTVIVAQVPVLVGHHTVHQAAVVQHRQIEATAVPAHQLRCVLFNGLEKGLNHFGFAVAIAVDKGVNAQTLGIAKHAADAQDALQVQGHEVAFAFRSPLGLPLRMHLSVTQLRVIGVKPTPPRHVGDGFDVKNKDRPGHRSGLCVGA